MSWLGKVQSFVGHAAQQASEVLNPSVKTKVDLFRTNWQAILNFYNDINDKHAGSSVDEMDPLGTSFARFRGRAPRRLVHGALRESASGRGAGPRGCVSSTSRAPFFRARAACVPRRARGGLVVCARGGASDGHCC